VQRSLRAIVVARDNQVLLVDFDNGERATLDMKPFLDFGVFQKLREHDYFKQVHVSFDTIAWESGIDLDPEFVSQKCRPLSEDNEARDVPVSKLEVVAVT